MHPFDRAIALEPLGQSRFAGHTSADYQNMVGPFGGITAAVLLNAVMQHPDRLGEPTSMTVNFAGPVPDGPFEILARPVRTNRSTQHWLLEQWVQENGQPAIATTATVLTAVRRPTWSATDCPAPLLGGPGPDQAPTIITHFTPWLRQYTLVPLEGDMPSEWDGRENAESLSRFWVRKTTPRTLDFCALAAVCDIFYPRTWLRRAHQVPAGTVSMTMYFHAGAQDIAQAGDDYLLAQARGQEYRNNFSDQSGLLWRTDGLMLASTHQMLYYKQ
ncbi:thioesterase family protein [Allofranklinella schreckenbergeri]|uniref:Thioesterase family protein n=1 Tax=Allofranklinella schreckenbergeri TaxID=1076744 RepID=A0A3M6R7Q2_9BURK|nr:thioesterase family protein [Allofranklinella schreckenbergeri]RMW96090.1 thioesterase family protein [Allofranklinella schreckenbergeri]RMX00246.1 thioesterase family protein [Allofranklinella schreckenbergeri]RMX10758.1 thioesterase family protein [Allofranklinella schreckenbergeri]RRD44785.1 thioesterase family protein [Comamonadaceae bacterium OH3737_COT-264]